MEVLQRQEYEDRFEFSEVSAHTLTEMEFNIHYLNAKEIFKRTFVTRFNIHLIQLLKRSHREKCPIYRWIV